MMHKNYQQLKQLGFTSSEIRMIEDTYPTVQRQNELIARLISGELAADELRKMCSKVRIRDELHRTNEELPM